MKEKPIKFVQKYPKLWRDKEEDEPDLQNYHQKTHVSSVLSSLDEESPKNHHHNHESFLRNRTFKFSRMKRPPNITNEQTLEKDFSIPFSCPSVQIIPYPNPSILSLCHVSLLVGQEVILSLLFLTTHRCLLAISNSPEDEMEMGANLRRKTETNQVCTEERFLQVASLLSLTVLFMLFFTYMARRRHVFVSSKDVDIHRKDEHEEEEEEDGSMKQKTRKHVQPNESPHSQFIARTRGKVMTRVMDAILLAILLRFLSSLLQSLTISYSSDTVYTLAILGMIVHVGTCDYTYANGRNVNPNVPARSSIIPRKGSSASLLSSSFSSWTDSQEIYQRPHFLGGTISLNSILFSIVLLTSRLPAPDIATTKNHTSSSSSTIQSEESKVTRREDQNSFFPLDGSRFDWSFLPMETKSSSSLNIWISYCFILSSVILFAFYPAARHMISYDFHFFLNDHDYKDDKNQNIQNSSTDRSILYPWRQERHRRKQGVFPDWALLIYSPNLLITITLAFSTSLLLYNTWEKIVYGSLIVWITVITPLWTWRRLGKKIKIVGPWDIPSLQELRGDITQIRIGK